MPSNRAQVDLNTAQRELKRNADLIEAGVASRLEYDAARDRFDQAKISVRHRQSKFGVAEDRREGSRGACEPATDCRARRANRNQVVGDARESATSSAARSIKPAIKSNSALAFERRHRGHSRSSW